MTLPLSYSRLGFVIPEGLRPSDSPSRSLAFISRPSRSSLAEGERAKAGGEGRTRTFEGARPTDLQSAAFDRFATSPCQTPTPSDAAPFDSSLFVFLSRSANRSAICLETSSGPCDVREWGAAWNMELAKGFEPPTG